jgi:DNA adenine methylase
MRPFLKWPGGKRWLISRYQHIFPQNYNRYFEPFLGGGSTFFHLQPRQATISDINIDLINTYRMMARNPAQLRILLEDHQANHSVEYYYLVRDNIPDNALARAARFLYLNRTCFNGMYRVNQLGHFNVPIGTREHFVDDVHLFEEYSRILQNVHIRTQDFVNTIHDANEGDLIFADPPYTIAHNQNSFIKYNERLFSWKDQKRLLRALIRARERGAMIIATNAYYPALQQMYQENHFYTQALNRFSSISGLAEGRGNQEELLVSSYPINLQEGLQ